MPCVREAHHITHLLQQHRVVSLKGLEDVVVAAQLPQPVDSGIAMAPCGLTTYTQGLLGEGSGVGLEPSTVNVTFTNEEESCHTE